MTLHEEAVLVRTQVKQPRDVFGIRARLHRGRKDHHIHGQFDELPRNGVFRFDDQTARFIGALGNARTFAADELHVLFNDAVVKFFIAFAGGAHVDIKLIDVGGGFLLEQMREFERIHAAHAAAVFVVILIPAADTVKNSDGLRLLAVPKRHFAAGGAGGIKEPFHFQSIIHTGIFAVAILNQFPGIHEIITRGHNDGSHFHRAEGVLLIKINRLLLADLFAQTAFAFEKECTGVPINDGFLRHGLRKRNVNGLPFYQTFIPFRHAFPGTFFRAGQAGVAFRVIHVTGFLFDRDIKVADEPLDFAHFTGGHHGDVFMLQHGIHLGCQNAGGTIQRGERLVKLRHMSADGRILFDEINLLAGVGQLERGLDTGDAAADDQDIGINVNHARGERRQKPGTVHRAVQERFGLGGAFFNIMRDPGYLLADVHDGQQILIKARGREHLAESLFVHQRRTSGHNNAIQLMFFDVIGDHFLSGCGTHELVIPGDNHIRQRGRKLGQFAHPNRLGYIQTAVANKNTNSAHTFSLSITLVIFVKTNPFVIPGKRSATRNPVFKRSWIPAFAGMTLLVTF